ncbi:acyl-CoA dehydrogenase C-terminal domain-containing protein [Alteraurantiacibacter aestuarii]|uniref:acyl-CoA dehydrogenase C-terminal domain-containing protein n=1 Tax=Alteraurantiacibacter aestuarii TaxID=650004 RepID=UPI0031E19D40
MPIYSPPERESAFILKDLLQIDGLDEDLVDTIISEAGRFAAEVIAPLNPVSDAEGCTRHADGSVTTPSGFVQAYAAYAESGWGTLALPEEFGGQDMPHVLATVVEEYLNSACHAFNMFPGLTHGAVSAIMSVGTDEQKQTYLPPLVSGEWLGTMALTEAHAGTDLGLLRTKAEPAGDGTYRITGEKIFCSGGEQDLTENIIHLVLARLPDAPAGSRGISLFIVPKILSEGGARNAVSCNSIEHKMGVHGSATCVMNFDGATGYLLGTENQGLAAMFIMMNAARLSCGNQGLAQAELAYQNALAYAMDRRQGRAPGGRADPAQAADPLLVHADVRRMLMDAKGFTEGFRALVAWTASQIDVVHGEGEESARHAADELVGFLTPVLKGYGTDMGFQTAVSMQQILGGHGYVAEWGMEQIVRDARVAMLYEGANGVQALDLAARKLAKDGGQVAERFFAMIEDDCDAAPEWIAQPLASSLGDAREAARWLIGNAAADPDNLGAGSYAFMQLVGVLSIGWMWARIATLAGARDDDPFMQAKLVTARHYATRALPETGLLKQRAMAGAETLMALSPEQLQRG